MKKTTIFTQQISNVPMEGLEDIKRTVNVTDVKIMGSYNEFIIEYFISYDREDKPVPKLLREVLMPWVIGNDVLISERDSNMQPIDNPEYILAVEANKLPKEIEIENELGEVIEIPNPDYLSDEELALIDPHIKHPGFTYLWNIINGNLAVALDLLKFYVVENDKDGFFNADL